MSLRERIATFAQKREARLTTLRAVIDSIRSPGVVEALPNDFAHILDQYDRASTDPTFRADIHSLLATSASIARIALDLTFDSDQALRAIAAQQEVLARMVLYLSQRPTRTGYSILFAGTGQLFGQFTTEEEAQAMLAALSSRSNAVTVVVPVRITSQFSVHPSTNPPELNEAVGLPDRLPTILQPLQDAADDHNPDFPLGSFENGPAAPTPDGTAGPEPDGSGAKTA